MVLAGNTPELGDWVPQFGKRLKRDSSGNVCVLLDLPAGAEFKVRDHASYACLAFAKTAKLTRKAVYKA